MDTLTKHPRLRLLRILFFICEAAFVASFAVNEVLWHRYHRAATDARAVFMFTFLISLVALVVVCFCLRRTARLLAVIGWITAFVLFWYAALTPEL
jgi:hypothetical protein